MNILGWLLFGLVVGAIAKLMMPGKDPGGWIVTILLGIAGSFVGGFLAQALMGRNESSAGWIGSIIGALVLLFVYRLIVGRQGIKAVFATIILAVIFVSPNSTASSPMHWLASALSCSTR